MYRELWVEANKKPEEMILSLRNEYGKHSGLSRDKYIPTPYYFKSGSQVYFPIHAIEFLARNPEDITSINEILSYEEWFWEGEERRKARE